MISVNIRRRHLNPAQKEALLIAFIARNPAKSDRQLGKEIGVDHKTIGAARRKGEDVGSIPHVETHTDTRGREQPASKPKAVAKSPVAKPVSSVTKDSSRSKSATQDRSLAIVAFSTLLHNKTTETLEDLVRILADERARIAQLPQHKRDSIARAYLNALDIKLSDLQPLESVPLGPSANGVERFPDGLSISFPPKGAA